MADILIVAAHPDDEILGCGGTMARYASNGDLVHVLILADGETARDQGASQSTIEMRQDAARAAAKEVGALPPVFAGLPDNRMDGVELLDVVKIVEKTVEDVGPEQIFTHSPGDLNIDHQVTCRAVMTAARPQPGSPVRRINLFEVPSSTEWALPHASSAFLPNAFIDITDFLEKKIAALGHYAAEMRNWPHARSNEAVEALARHRGSSVGRPAAEAFMIARDLIV
jgi:LmbE family N-acetylglucosaminyl deacetylase